MSFLVDIIFTVASVVGGCVIPYYILTIKYTPHRHQKKPPKQTKIVHKNIKNKTHKSTKAAAQ